MDMHHIGEFGDSGMLAHQDRDFLDDVGCMSAIGVAAEDETVVQTPPGPS